MPRGQPGRGQGKQLPGAVEEQGWRKEPGGGRNPARREAKVGGGPGTGLGKGGIRNVRRRLLTAL